MPHAFAVVLIALWLFGYFHSRALGGFIHVPLFVAIPVITAGPVQGRSV